MMVHVQKQNASFKKNTKIRRYKDFLINKINRCKRKFLGHNRRDAHKYLVNKDAGSQTHQSLRHIPKHSSSKLTLESTQVRSEIHFGLPMLICAYSRSKDSKQTHAYEVDVLHERGSEAKSDDLYSARSKLLNDKIGARYA